MLSSQINYTLTHLADHIESFSHDTINRYLRNERITPRLLWENVKKQIQLHQKAYLVFDDTVLDKRYAKKIELTRRQYSGNEHRVLRGIGLVSCVYVNPDTKQFWVIDYRIYAPDSDSKTKLDHVSDILLGLANYKQLPFACVLMDSWYATQKLMLLIDEMGKIYYCPLKKNRLVDETGGVKKYKTIQQLDWNETETIAGKTIKIKGFPGAKKVKLFRVVVSTDKTEFIATNDKTQNSMDAVQEVCDVRWKIEEFHREIKQLTGIEACQCRLGRPSEKSHWLRLTCLGQT